MPTHRRLETGETVRFVLGDVKLVDNNPVVPRNGANIVGNNERELMAGALRVGAVGYVFNVMKKYPQAVLAAGKYRFISEVGVRPPKGGYHPGLNSQEKSAAMVKVKDQLNWEKSTRQQQLTVSAEYIKERRAKMVESAKRAKGYAHQVEQVVDRAKSDQRDPIAMEELAKQTIGTEVSKHELPRAFFAGQATSAVVREPTAAEIAVATACIESEKRSGRKWSKTERTNWVMAELGRKALNVIQDSGRLISQVEEYWKLRQLDLTDPVSEANHLTEHVILEIPPLDIAIAGTLGAQRPAEGMLLGVKLVLGANNAASIRDLGGRNQLARTFDNLEVDVTPVNDVAALNTVRSGDFGGQGFRNLVNKIVGNKFGNDIPLPGTLVLGNTETDGQEDNVPIPVLNPDLASQTINETRRAIAIIARRQEQLAATNELVDISPQDLRVPIIERTIGAIRGLPNAGKVNAIVENSMRRADTVEKAPESLSVKQYLDIDISSEKATDVIFNRNEAIRNYLRNKFPGHGDDIGICLEDRAVKLLMDNPSFARQYRARRVHFQMLLQESNPTEWPVLQRLLDDQCAKTLGLKN